MPRRAPQHRAYVPAARTHAPKQESRQKRRALHTGSKAWRTLRAVVLADELYLCRQCGRYGDHVDHIDGDAANNARGNLAVLCRACHATKTAKEDGGFGNRKRAAADPARNG